MTDAELTRIARSWARQLGDERTLEVRWNDRMRSLAGLAAFASRIIDLNARLLRRRPKETLSTLAHEVCHLVAGSRAGHGDKWVSAMERLGFVPETAHRLDVSHLVHRRRRWTWRCVRCAERIVRTHTGAHRFRCLCGGDLVVASNGRRPPVGAPRPERSRPQPVAASRSIERRSLPSARSAAGSGAPRSGKRR